MATFQALDEYLDDTINLPIMGKVYCIKSPDAKTGLLVSRMLGLAMDAAEGAEITDDQRIGLVLSDEDERELMSRLMGDAMDEMVEDGVSWATIQHAQQTVMVWCAYGQEAAATFWGRYLPKQPKTPQDRRSKKRTTR